MKWLRGKYPSTSVLVAAPVTKGLLLAVKWTYLEHHFLRHQRKSKEGNCVKLSRRVVLCYRYIRKYMLFTGREVRIGKNCDRGLEYGPRPAASGRTQDQGHSFSLYGPT